MLQQYNLSLQYELLSGLLVEASYAGARGVHWVQRVDINTIRFEDVLAGKNRQADRPFPFLVSWVGLDTANVSNRYNSFSLRIERRFAQGLTALANYTISRNVDTGNAGISTFSNQGNTRPMDSYNLKLEKALSPTDIPQKFVLNGGYELPIGRGKPLAGSVRGLTDKLIGGWQINGILLIRSGFPTDALVSVAPPVFGTINRPDRVLGEPTVVDNPGFDQYFNPKAFAVPGTVPDFRGPPVRKFGNSGRNVLRGPGSRNLDFSLFKDIALTEHKRLEFRAEAFNLSNTPAFDLPGARTAALTVGNASFGKLGSAQTVGRQVQFGLKLLW